MPYSNGSKRIFITSREKMHPTGIQLYDELLAKLERRTSMVPLEQRGSGK